MNRLAFVALAFLILPLQAVAELRITELAWMGTSVSADDEWIELYNDEGEPLSLSGYRLEWGSGSPPKKALLSGTTTTGGYLLLERTNDDSVPGIKADVICHGALVDGGEVIYIKKEDGTVIFTLNLNVLGGWLAGDKSTKETMQWNGNAWVTATATPKAPYLGSATSTNNTATSTATTTAETAIVAQSISSHSSPVALSVAPAKSIITISLGRDRLGLVDIPLLFSIFSFDSTGSPFRGNISTRWSFGDGSVSDGVESRHSYSSPGEYVVIATARYLGEEAVARINVSVVVPELVLFYNEYGVGVVNNGKTEVNIGGFVLGDEKDSVTFPEDVIIKSKASVIFSTSTQSVLKNISNIFLYSPLKKVVTGPVVHRDKKEETLAVLSQEAKTLVIANLEKEINALRVKIAQSSFLPKKKINKIVTDSPTVVPATDNKTLPEKSVALLAPIVIKKEPGFLTKVVQLPARAWKAFKERVF